MRMRMLGQMMAGVVYIAIGGPTIARLRTRAGAAAHLLSIPSRMHACDRRGYVRHIRRVYIRTRPTGVLINSITLPDGASV